MCEGEGEDNGWKESKRERDKERDIRKRNKEREKRESDGGRE